MDLHPTQFADVLASYTIRDIILDGVYQARLRHHQEPLTLLIPYHVVCDFLAHEAEVMERDAWHPREPMEGAGWIMGMAVYFSPYHDAGAVVSARPHGPYKEFMRNCLQGHRQCIHLTFPQQAPPAI